MPSTFRYLAAVLVFGAAFAHHLGAQSDNQPRIVTTGIGEVTLTPDWATLAIDVTADDSSAVVAAAASTAATRRVVAALASLGYAGDSLVRVSFSVQPRYNYAEQELRGYQGRGTVRVEVRQLDRLAKIIDTVLVAGATGVSGLRFHSDKEDEARGEALKQAVAQARADADVLAVAAGGRLGPPLAIRTDRSVLPSFGFAELAGYARSGGDAAPELTVQDVIVLVAVETEWQLVISRR